MDRAPFLIAFALTAVGALLAQSPPTTDRLALGASVRGGPDWDEVARLPGAGWGMRPERRLDGTLAVGRSVFDAAAGDVLAPHGDRLELQRLGGGVRWARPLAELDVDPDGVAQAWLTRERVVLSTRRGLLALARRDGARVWSCDTAGTMRLVTGELVVAAGADHEGAWLQAWAISNGARAFRHTLPGSVRQLAATDGAILVRGDAYWAVFDRSGPQWFRREEAMLDVAGSGAALYARSATEVLAVDRRGVVAWRVPIQPTEWHELALATAGNGDLLLVGWIRMSDSGARLQCLRASDGTSRWQCDLPGLGVDHSKYWQHVVARAFGDAVLVVSDAAGGQWACELAAHDGSVRRRVALTNH